MENLLEKIKRKQLVFTITTGRSGTKYLAYLLGLLKDFRSEHEEKPAFHEYYRTIIDGKYSFKKFWLEKKLPYIATQVEEHFYADASHMGCKGFFEPLIELGIQPCFIFLKRENRAVAKSLWELNTIPYRTIKGLKYLNSPYDKRVLQIDGDIKKLTDYQLCYWYTLENDRAGKYYKSFFNEHNCSYIEISFDELIKADGILRIKKEMHLSNFSFVGRMKYFKNKDIVLNSKKNRKSKKENIDFEAEELALSKIIKN